MQGKLSNCASGVAPRDQYGTHWHAWRARAIDAPSSFPLPPQQLWNRSGL